MKAKRLEIRLTEAQRAKFESLADTLGLSLVDMISQAVSELELQTNPDYYAEVDKILKQIFRLQQIMQHPIMMQDEEGNLTDIELSETEQELYNRLEHAHDVLCFSNIVQEDKRSYVIDDDEIKRFRFAAYKDPLCP